MSVEICIHGVGRAKTIPHIAMQPRKGWIIPSKDYLSAMLKGLKQHGFSNDVIKEIKRAAKVSTIP